jgi:hypothetical protein
MAEVPQDMKKLLFGMGAKWHAIAAMVLDFLGLGCLIVGIIASATEEGLGLLWPQDWFFMAIAFIVFGLWAWLAAYFAAKEG